MKSICADLYSKNLINQKFSQRIENNPKLILETIIDQTIGNRYVIPGE